MLLLYRFMFYDDTAPRSGHVFCRFSMSPRNRHRNFGRSIYTHARATIVELTSRTSIVHIDAPSDWDIAPLRQGGIHATFLQISCRNIEHTRHMGWMLLFCALTSRWEEYCIIHLCQKPIYEIISAYNDESNEYIHKASELMSLQDCLWVVRILCCRKCCCGRQS